MLFWLYVFSYLELSEKGSESVNFSEKELEVTTFAWYLPLTGKRSFCLKKSPNYAFDCWFQRSQT